MDACQVTSRHPAVCGAQRYRDGKPRQDKIESGKRRCKWRGGCSTGPKTPDGRKRALANLRQFRPR
ncbi:HGGxSTG domain-containing protein [Dokdonella sp.]|uniref:HGGxSTG domain-containing protein n=1 Tax=Dokdonella sp. TaxID=2291710 RepID=UPI003BAE5206